MFSVQIELKSGAEIALGEIRSISWTKARVIFSTYDDKTFMYNTDEILTCIIVRR